ncbi:hypothetical protein N9Y92_04005 [Chlamydiales bacterium]|nr:hypothetical protein [Chlamydiales bacterium]
MKTESCGTESVTERCGVLQDLTSGALNLKELQQMQVEKKEHNGKSPLLEQKEKEIIGKMKDLQTKGLKNNPKYYALQYALEQLADIDKTTTTRTELLSDKFLQLLNSHIESMSPEEIKSMENGSPLKISHLLLLNEKSISTDPSGWVHNEANGIQDQSAIFDLFDNATLIFDGKGPLVEINEKGERVVHLAQGPEIDGTPPKELKLKTYLMNCSVQGFQKNQGSMQQELNLATFKKMNAKDEMSALLGIEITEGEHGILLDIQKAVENAVENGDKLPFEDQIRDHVVHFTKDMKLTAKTQQLLIEHLSLNYEIKNGSITSYNLADKIATHLENCKMKKGVSCQSAKDRTGAICDRISFGHAIRQHPHLYNKETGTFTKKGEKVFESYITKMFAGELISGKVAFQNLSEQGHHIKVNPFAKGAGGKFLQRVGNAAATVPRVNRSSKLNLLNRSITSLGPSDLNSSSSSINSNESFSSKTSG